MKPSPSSMASIRLIDVWPSTNRSHSHGTGGEPEQVADDDRVGAGVGDERDPGVRLVGSARPAAPSPSARRRDRRGTVVSPRGSGRRSHASVHRPSQAVPALLGACGPLSSAIGLGWPSRRVCRARSGCGSPRARGRSISGRPRASRQRLRRLARPTNGEHEDLVELLVPQRIGQQRRLSMTALGERRVVDVQALAHPFRLTVSDQHDLHCCDCRGTAGGRHDAAEVDDR